MECTKRADYERKTVYQYKGQIEMEIALNRPSKKTKYLKFNLATQIEELNEIFSLREAIYKLTKPYLLGLDHKLHPGADQFDNYSYIFYCQESTKIVSATRFTPSALGDKHWETTELISNDKIPSYIDDKYLEISRLVLAPTIRNRLVAEVMIYFACSWLYEHTSFTNYFAICSLPLVRFYYHFGATIISSESFYIPGRGKTKYYLIGGNILQTANNLYNFLRERNIIDFTGTTAQLAV
jgi:hypothetical protein